MSMSIYAQQARSAPTNHVYQPPKEKFPYGWRYVTHTLPNGEVYEEIPLTQEDFLDPQLGDKMVQNTKHYGSNNDLFDMFNNRYALDPTTRVFGDLKMIWGIPGLKEPAPDIAIVPNLKNKDADRSSFDVVKEGTRPSLVIEVISPKYPGDDTDKVKIYERVGVQEYIIIDPHSDKVKPYYEIGGYRLDGGKYRPIKPDRRGRLLSQTTNVLFGVYNKGRRLRLRDALTGKWLLTAQESETGRLKAEKRAQKAEARAQKVEAQAQAEAKARQDAEARAQELEKRLRELKAKRQ